MSKGKVVSGKTLLRKHVSKKDHVLLLNPPIFETRYSWLRWNQPLDLLKLGSFLRSQVGCPVELLDCMKPDRDGHVHEERRAGSERYQTIGGMRYPIRRFGLSQASLTKWLEQKKTLDFRNIPTQVWITSLCSYWFESYCDMCRVVKQTLPDSEIVLIGQYPSLLPDHAKENCIADVIVPGPVEVGNALSAVDLYGQEAPPFIGVKLDPQTAVEEIRNAVNRQIFRVALFDSDLCRDDGESLNEIYQKTKDFHKHLRFHAICGVDPTKMTPRLAKIFADKQFAEVHFEQADGKSELDLETYKRTRCYLEEAGVRMPDERFCGFVWIGRPKEALEQIILNSFHVVEMLGGLILKPFTPTPGSTEHLKYSKYLSSVRQQNWSPHFFPFSELNGITREEYHDLYRMAAFLNERVRNKPFDFLRGTLGAQMLRESLSKEVWKLEPSPFRVIDQPANL